MYKYSYICKKITNKQNTMRNYELIKKRNKKIAERFYYWTEKRRVRVDDTIRILSEEEFFLSEYIILKILRNLIKSGIVEPPQYTFAGFRVK